MSVRIKIVRAEQNIMLSTLWRFFADVAVVTGLYFATYQIGSALAASISGAIWTQTLKSRLTRELGSSTIAAAVYADPYGSIVTYTWDTPERQAIVRAYQHVQKILCIVGLCVGFLLIFFGACLRDRKLGDEQSRPDAEEEEKA
jgi:SIT family siderophore-iron:H+ symporter-like MFS transporter